MMIKYRKFIKCTWIFLLNIVSLISIFLTEKEIKNEVLQNIGNYMQQDPILNAADPFSPAFNSSSVWGPLMGRKFYIGLRYNLY